MDLDDVAEELYGLPQAQFVEVRTQRAAQAKADGDRELSRQITQLRKPTAAAWAVNLLVRRRAEDVTALLDLGDQLREAQAGLAGDALRELTKQRRQLVAVLARAARSEAHAAGQAISEAAEQEVAQTLLAALADPRAGDAVRSGRLTASLSYSGVGPVDESALESALATVSDLAERRRARQHSGGDGAAAEADQAGKEAERRRAALQRQRREEAAARLATARAEQDRAEAAAEQAHSAWATAEASERKAVDDVERLEAALEAAREAVSSAKRSVTTAERERRAAQRHAEVARQAARRAQAEFDQLADPDSG